MATKATPAKSKPAKARPAKLKNGRKPQAWYVLVHLVDGRPRPQRDWRYGMRKGDKVKFESPNGVLKVRFEAADDNYKSVPHGLLPFGPEKKQMVIQGAKETHEIVNPCRCIMYCSVKPTGKKRFVGWEEDDPRAGTNVCTGGGSKPCP